MKRIALPAVLSLLAGMPAVFAQLRAPISSPLDASNFIAGNIAVGGALVIAVMIVTIFIENYLKNKGYTERLGGPKVPGAICAILIVISMIGAYVPIVSETAGPIVGAFIFLVGFWYVGMIGMAFASTAVGKSELLREKAALAEAEAAAYELRKEGVSGATQYVQEAKVEIQVIHDIKKLRDEMLEAGMTNEAEEVEQELKDQEQGLELETIIFTMSQLEAKMETTDPVWPIIRKILPDLINDKIEKDKKDIERLRAGQKSLLQEIELIKREGRHLKDRKESKKLAILEKSASIVERIIQELVREEKIAEKELYLDRLAKKAERKEMTKEAREARKKFFEETGA